MFFGTWGSFAEVIWDEQVKSPICGLLLFLKPDCGFWWSVSPGVLELTDPVCLLQMCSNQDMCKWEATSKGDRDHASWQKHSRQDGAAAKRSKLPRVGLTLLLVNNDTNLTGVGLWDHNNRESGWLAGNSPVSLEILEVWSRFPGGLQGWSPAGWMLMLSFCCWCELVIAPDSLLLIFEGHSSEHFFWGWVSGMKVFWVSQKNLANEDVGKLQLWVWVGQPKARSWEIVLQSL